jgi:hypothetical protein
LFAFQGSPERRNDLDDVRSILLNFKNLDHSYIEENLRANSVQIPASLELSFKVPSASPSKKPL